MKRLAALSLGMLFLTVPALARVLSYSPYSSRPAQTGIHERMSRRFVLIETLEQYDQAEQVVLYDTKGEEPRVVFPPAGNTGPAATYVYAAALYERKSRPDLPPLLLVVANGVSWEPRTYLSKDGGATWTELPGLVGRSPAISNFSDFGGPWTQGIANGIRLGNDERPFIISYGYGDVYAVSAQGQATALQWETSSSIAGQDRDGNQLLIRTYSFLFLLDLTTGTRRLLGMSQPSANYAGWITADGSAYILVSYGGEQFLYRQASGPAELIMAGYGQRRGRSTRSGRRPTSTPTLASSPFRQPTSKAPGCCRSIRASRPRSPVTPQRPASSRCGATSAVRTWRR